MCVLAGATQLAAWNCVLLNTLTLAMTCSTYFQLCGNGGVREGLQDSSFLHQAVCAHWLSPISTTEYPNFSAWMLYGERSDDAVPSKPAVPPSAAPSARGSPGSSSSSSSSSIFNASFWWGAPAPPPPPADEGFGLGAFNASQLAELVSPVSGPDSTGSVISPVFTMWITLVALYIGRCAVYIGIWGSRFYISAQWGQVAVLAVALHMLRPACPAAMVWNACHATL
jgi:hypothetical protein